MSQLLYLTLCVPAVLFSLSTYHGLYYVMGYENKEHGSEIAWKAWYYQVVIASIVPVKLLFGDLSSYFTACDSQWKPCFTGNVVALLVNLLLGLIFIIDVFSLGLGERMFGVDGIFYLVPCIAVASELS